MTQIENPNNLPGQEVLDPNSTAIQQENSDSSEKSLKFSDLGLSAEVLEGVQKAGYETPSPIQAKAIPIFLSGKNLLGTAQTGTGKTAAFTLPLLSRIAFKKNETSMLVLSPTRELAIQVAEAIQHFAVAMPQVHIVPVYGGQDIGIQLRALKRTPQIVVATPGRLIDHLKRKTISLENVQAVVLDEADEMLDMGFMDEVEEILSKIPAEAQRGLFSATMPANVKKIIERYLGKYEEACIEAKTATVDKVRQRYLTIRSVQKMEALTRVLEGETYDGVIIFVRTKQSTAEVAERLEARGFNAAPLSGDLAQTLRERTINRLKEGKIDGQTYTMLEFELETGRKNQIRVQAQWIGHPVAGDKKYGARTNPLGRLALHARTLSFIHPHTGKTLSFTSRLPKGFRF